MKIATFNINNINRRLPNLLEWLRESQPDIAGLQELKSIDAQFPADALRKAGYHAVWRGQKDVEWRCHSVPPCRTDRHPHRTPG